MADAGFLPPWLTGALDFGAGVLTGAPQPAHQMDLRKLILSACLPVLKVLIIAGTGLVLATPYMGVLNVEARKHISKLVFVLLLPALVFVKLGQGVDITNMIKWYFIPINIVAGCLIGSFLGYLVVLICKPPQEYARLVIFTVGIGNMGNLPLVLVTAVCQDPSNPFGDTASCLARGVSYVAFGMWPLAIILWTLVYDSLQLPAEHSLRMGTTPRRRIRAARPAARGLRAQVNQEHLQKERLRQEPMFFGNVFNLLVGAWLDQYLADLLALTKFAIDNSNVSSRLVHAKLIGRSVFGERGEASDAAAKLRGLFTPREQLALANRFKMNFPALDMGEVDRIRNLFTPTDWRRHKRSLRVYEGYLGFQYMGQETDETDYTNMVWDLPLVKGAFSPNGTLLSYWSKYQAPNEKDAMKLRLTLRSLKHMGTVILPAPHHRHPQHRQLTRVAFPLIQEELPHATIMLYEDLTGFTHLRANMLNCIEGGTGMWMAKVWEAYGSQEARNPYRAMWYNHVRRAALREADVIEEQVREEKWQHLAERFVVGTLKKVAA